MSQHAARCPFCVNVVQVQPTFLERIGMRKGRRQCTVCRRVYEAHDAETMGAAYGRLVERFIGELRDLVSGLPLMTDQAIERALGRPPKDETRLVPSLSELARLCTHHNRAVLVEMTRGRPAALDSAHLTDTAGNPELVAVLGKGSAESGERECELLIARSGVAHYVLYAHPIKAGAEPRVRRAVHEKPTSAERAANLASGYPVAGRAANAASGSPVAGRASNAASGHPVDKTHA